MEVVSEIRGVFSPPTFTSQVLPLGVGLMVTDWAGDRVRSYVAKVPVISAIADPASEMLVGTGIVALSTFMPSDWKGPVKWIGIGGIALGVGHLIGTVIAKLRGSKSSSSTSSSPSPSMSSSSTARAGYY
jgi:hypothetical protein